MAALTALSAALGIGGLASNIFANQNNQANFERQQKFAEYQYKDMKQYNSAEEQVKRLRAAGLNPALVFGGDSGMASSVSQPSPTPQVPLELSGLSSLSDSIALNDSQRDKNESEVRINKLRSNGIELENMLNQKFASIEREEGVKKLKNDVVKSYNEGLLLAAQGDYTKALEKLAKAEEFMNYGLGGKYHQEMLNAEEDFKWISSKARAYISHLKMQNRMLSSQADLFDSQRDLNKNEYDIRSDDEVKKAIKDTYVETLNKLKADKKISDEESRRIVALADKAEKESNAYYWQLIYEDLLKGGATAAELLSFKKKIQALSSLSDAAERNSETRAQRLEHERDMDLNTYEETNEFTFKNGKSHRTKGTTRGRRRK